MSPRQLTVEYLAIGAVKPDPLNPRRHSPKQLRQLVASIERFGFVNPILIDNTAVIVAGHGRLAAAKLAGLTDVPVIRIGALSEPERRALMVADNRLAENSAWDADLLQDVLKSLVELDVAVDNLGFDAGELDLALGAADSAGVFDDADMVEEIDLERQVVASAGDVFRLGEHMLACGDARDAAIYEALFGPACARIVFTDPPYNVPIHGHAVGLGAVRHRPFAMASGEMSAEEFTAFLHDVLRRIAEVCADGTILYVCMDWRHLHELMNAANGLLTLKNLCVWAKDNGGMGSLYRSQHELVCVFKKGAAPHVNNVNLGRLGRNRTNVWRYPGANTLRKGRLTDLKDHPTIKPVALVADALLDCSQPGDLVLDPFAGSGTILLAAHRTWRRARAIEIDPRYVDTAIRRFRQRTAIEAVHVATGLTFAELAQKREREGAAQ